MKGRAGGEDRVVGEKGEGCVGEEEHGGWRLWLGSCLSGGFGSGW